jgi:hypothetical protein
MYQVGGYLRLDIAARSLMLKNPTMGESLVIAAHGKMASFFGYLIVYKGALQKDQVVIRKG